MRISANLKQHVVSVPATTEMKTKTTAKILIALALMVPVIACGGQWVWYGQAAINKPGGYTGFANFDINESTLDDCGGDYELECPNWSGNGCVMREYLWSGYQRDDYMSSSTPVYNTHAISDDFIQEGCFYQRIAIGGYLIDGDVMVDADRDWLE